MTTISSSVTVERPSAAVFDYLVDPANQVRWPEFPGARAAARRPIGLGHQVPGRLKNFGSLEFVYDEFEASGKFRMATDHRPAHEPSLHGQDEGDSTRVEHEVRLSREGSLALPRH